MPTLAAAGADVFTHASVQLPLASHQNGPSCPPYSPVRCAMMRMPSMLVCIAMTLRFCSLS